MCEQKEISLVDHGNISTRRHFKKADFILMLMVNLFLLNILEVLKKNLIDGASGITEIT